MVGDKNLTNVFFIEFSNQKKNTAAQNRRLAISKMASIHFNIETIKTPTYQVYKSKNIILRGLAIRYAFLKALLDIKKLIRHNYFGYNNVLYVFGLDATLTIFAKIFCLNNRIQLITERNEYPSAIIRGKRFLVFLEKNLIYSWYFKLYDGFSLISENLIQFYGQYINKTAVIKKLPIAIDISRFPINIMKINNEKYIFYAGSISEQKDGVESLIRAYSKIHTLIPDLKLKLAGGSSEGINALIQKYNLFDKVILLGNINRDDIPKLMIESYICVLARPESKQAEGGFPTKLGEYLASAKPVIVTDVGEIPYYLTHKVNAYLISRYNIDAELVDTIIDINDNYIEALKIGRNGRKLAVEKFSLEANSNVVKVLINEVLIRKIELNNENSY